MMSHRCRLFIARVLQGPLLGLLVAGVITGCAGLPGGMAAPTVTIADFGMGDASLFEQQFKLKLRVQNPNPDEFMIDGVAFDLEVNDKPFATGVGNQSVTVPRFGSGLLPVDAVSSLGGLLKQIGRVVQSDNKLLIKYRVKGFLSVAGGTRIPFDQRGEFDFGSIVPK
jgi:LEA14-like dessication related protein